jgi:hypothetical protein
MSLDRLQSRIEELQSDLEKVRREFIIVKERDDGRFFVRVQFHGTPKMYCYELPPGYKAQVDDHLHVYSPRTYKDEIVVVRALGRGSWTGPTKIAHPIRWRDLDADPGEIF